MQLHDLVMIDIAANAFLHHMVRNMVGVLMQIGAGLKRPQWAKEVLEAKDRRQAAMTAPASGLYLIKVDYPDQYDLPKGPEVGLEKYLYGLNGIYSSE